MFEDSTFESNGKIHTRSRRWMLATLALNGSILTGLILIPLVFPEALPRIAMAILMEAPQPPAPETRPQPKQTAQVFHGEREMVGNQIFAPPRIPTGIRIFTGPEAPPNENIASLGSVPGSDNNVAVFSGSRNQPQVRHEPEHAVRVSGAIVAGLLMRKTVPAYPELAKAMRQEGTVVLAATISKQGAIENLRVVSGPAALQQAALDAVKTWRYRPYLLGGDPVEVETTVNVIFTLGR